MILAMDTASAHCSLALIEGEKCLAFSHQTMDRGQAEHMFPALEALLAKAGKQMADVTNLVVTKGPGSFTGVRLAIAAARAFSLANKIPISGLTTLEAVALTALANGDLKVGTRVLVAEDARRGEVYTEGFDVVDAPYPLKQFSPVEAIISGPLPAHLNHADMMIIGSGCALVGGTETNTTQRGSHAGLWGTKVEALLNDRKEPHIKPLYVRAPDAKPQKKLWLDQQI